MQLGSLVEVLGPKVLLTIALPQGLDVDLHRVVVAEPGVTIGAGDLVMLLPQIQHSGDATWHAYQSRWIRAAADSGAAAVVLKPVSTIVDGSPPIVRAPSEVALLAIHASVSWQRALVLLSAAVDSYGQTEGPSGDDFLHDLSTLADATSMAVGGAVAIMDGYSRIVAYSSQPGQPIDDVRADGILGRKVPQEFVGVHAETRHWGRGEVRLVDLPGTLPRLAAPIRAGDAFLGSVWVIVPPAGMSADMTSVVAAAARTAAVHLLRYTSSTSPSIWRAEQTQIRSRLLGREPPISAHHAAWVGTCVVLAVIARQEEAREDAVLLERLAVLVSLTLSGWQGAGCVVLDEVIYALLPMVGPHAEQDVRAVAETIARRSGDSLALAVGIGMSSATSDAVVGREQSFEAAQWAVAQGGVRTFEEIRVQTALTKISKMIVDLDLSLPVIDDIRAHDARHGAEYAKTLLVHLENGTNVALAAASLMVHPNTLRHRLRRISKLFNLPLNDPDERLAAWLFLRLALSGPQASPPAGHDQPSS